LPDPKQDPGPDSELKLPQKSYPDPESDPKQIIPDPQPWSLESVVVIICTDPVLDYGPSIDKKKNKKNLDFSCTDSRIRIRLKM
jgi:hypothetical protein